MPLVLLMLLLGTGLNPPLAACEFTTFRDAAYREPRDVHRLCVIGKADDAEVRRTRERLAAWLESSAVGLNLEVVQVDEEASNVRWEEYGIPSAPPSLPVVVLSGWRTLERKGFLIDHWEPAPDAKELELLKTSPARDAIRREVGRRLAVLVYVPGDASGPPSGTENVLDAVVAAWNKKEPLGLAVVRVNRTDERERLLLSFTGISRSGPDWVAVAFGRGKFMQPLTGEEITEASLNEQIEILIGECTCLRSPASSGVDIPLVWGKDLDQAVTPLRTEDPAAAPAPKASLAVDTPPSRRVFARTAGTLAVLVAGAGVSAAAIAWRRRDRRTI